MQTIDCTPTWEGVIGWYLTVLRDATPKGRAIAKKELTRMAEIAQHYDQKVLGNKENTNHKMYMGMHITVYLCGNIDKSISAREDIVKIARKADEYIAWQKKQPKHEA